MTMSSVAAQSITRATVGRALRQYRLAFAGNSRELNAVNRAALNLEACFWAFDGETLSIESATETGTTRYHVTAHGCGCPSAAHNKPCWHLAAFRLLQMAQDAPAPKRSFAEVQAAADSLF